MDTSRLLTLRQQKEAEDAARDALRTSAEYQNLQAAIESMQAHQEEILSRVSDCTPEYEAEKRAVMQYMKENGIDSLGNIVAVTRQRREVNVARLLRILDGDIDNLCVLAKVQQNVLRDFAKTDPRKKELLGCIEEGERDIIDLNFLAA